MNDLHSVMLVEDDPDFVFLIRQAIGQCQRLRFAGAAQSGEEGVALAQELRPRVVLMDLTLPGSMDGIDAARAIRLATHAKVLLLTSCEDSETIIRASKQSFASGYIFKSQCQTLADTICRTAEALTPQAAMIQELTLSQLSPAERSIAEMLLAGDVAASSAKKTIANQKTSIFRKLGLRSTAELVHIFRHW